jgi:Tfp pilus assembly protein PilO
VVGVRRTEQTIILGLVLVGLIVAFWLLVMSPKRNQASELKDEVAQLQTSLEQAQNEVASGERARRSFGIDYRRLVVLGKAVPADSEQTSLLLQLQTLAERSGVEFRTIDLADEGESAAPPPPTPEPSTASESTDSADADTASPPTDATAAVSAIASEASAATLPIGASIGPAGLPVMPYDVTFTGGFFEIADFMQRLDRMVEMRGGLIDVQGRLLTVNGFTLTPIGSESVETPDLTADLNVTTFLTPADQGVTAGATPTGPAPETPALVSGSESESAPTTEATATPTATATP